MRTREITPDSKSREQQVGVDTPVTPSNPFMSQEPPTVERTVETRRPPASPMSSFDYPEPEVEPEPVAPTDEPVAEKAEPSIAEARASTSPGPEWVRQDVPSLYVPYGFNDLYVRPITVPLLSKLFLAHKTKNFSLVVDVFNECVSEDARVLTPSDFNFLLYWIRDNSFTKTPITVSWLSKYNNRNELQFRSSTLTINEIEFSRDDFVPYREFGLCFPTVRDMELLKDDNTDPESYWMLDYAQYVALPTPSESYRTYVQDKLAALTALIEQHGLEDVILKINEFSVRIAHGVDETVKVRDKLFDPLKAADYFESLATNAFEVVAQLTEEQKRNEGLGAVGILQEANALLRDADNLRKRVAAGETVIADEEVVAIRIEATDFFPGLR